MDALPEVLRVVISEALTSGKKLSWSVWDNGTITSVKLLWKPEVVDAPIRSEIPPQPATSISHLGPRAHIKKKRSPSSWRRSKKRLKNFLEKKSCQERQEYATAVIGRSQESLAAPISAPQPLAPLQSQSSDDQNDADRSPEDAGFKGGKEVYQSGDPEHEEDDRSLGEVLQESCNIVYEAKDDTTGVSFEKNGVKEGYQLL